KTLAGSGKTGSVLKVFRLGESAAGEVAEVAVSRTDEFTTAALTLTRTRTGAGTVPAAAVTSAESVLRVGPSGGLAITTTVAHQWQPGEQIARSAGWVGAGFIGQLLAPPVGNWVGDRVSPLDERPDTCVDASTGQLVTAS
ncbi:MAG: hypothetical protein OEY23_27100, partial [Acidimicrobiia bacterium]|nr:hypothetical protein [Acidimicrobiia bacterium]